MVYGTTNDGDSNRLIVFFFLNFFFKLFCFKFRYKNFYALPVESAGTNSKRKVNNFD